MRFRILQVIYVYSLGLAGSKRKQTRTHTQHTHNTHTHDTHDTHKHTIHTNTRTHTIHTTTSTHTRILAHSKQMLTYTQHSFLAQAAPVISQLLWVCDFLRRRLERQLLVLMSFPQNLFRLKDESVSVCQCVTNEGVPVHVERRRCQCVVV